MTIVLNRPADFSPSELRAVLEGRSDRLAPGTALTLLAGQRPADIACDLEAIMEDRTRPATLRAHAVRLLAGAGGASLNDVLVATLADPQTAVVREAVRALGRLGDGSALDPVRRAATSADKRVRIEAELAVLTLSARHRLAGARFADWPCGDAVELAEDCGETAIIRKARKADFRAALTAFEDDPLDVAFVPADTQIIEGLGLDWQFLPVRGGPKHLLADTGVPVLLGVLAEWDPSDDRWFEGYLLFADPGTGQGSQRAIALIDTAAEIVMKGRLNRRRDAASFDLATCSPTMLQARLRGEITGDRFQFTAMLYRSALQGRRKADLFEPAFDQRSTG